MHVLSFVVHTPNLASPEVRGKRWSLLFPAFSPGTNFALRLRNPRWVAYRIKSLGVEHICLLRRHASAHLLPLFHICSSNRTRVPLPSCNCELVLRGRRFLNDNKDQGGQETQRRAGPPKRQLEKNEKGGPQIS